MTISYKQARQRIRAAYVEVDHSDLPAGTFVGLIELPNGAVPVGGFVTVITASSTPTTDVLDVGLSGTANAYGNDINAKSAARTALTGLPVAPYSGNTTIGLTRAETGDAATNGKYGLYVEYVIAGSSDFTQG